MTFEGQLKTKETKTLEVEPDEVPAAFVPSCSIFETKPVLKLFEAALDLGSMETVKRSAWLAYITATLV